MCHHPCHSRLSLIDNDIMSIDYVYYGVKPTTLLCISNNSSYLLFVLEITKSSKHIVEILVTLISTYQLAGGESSWTVLSSVTNVQLMVRFNYASDLKHGHRLILFSVG